MGEMKKELTSSLSGLNGRFEKQIRSVSRMHNLLHSVSDVVLGRRSAILSMRTQRQQVDARSCIGNAFMAVFPSLFPTDDIVDDVATSKGTVDWIALKDHLRLFFKSHLHFDAYSQVWLYRSIFSECSLADLLRVEGVQDIGENDTLPPLTHLPYERKSLGQWDENIEQLVSARNEDEFIEVILDISVPAFIWGFNVMKKVVALDHETIDIITAKLRTNQRLLERKQGVEFSSKWIEETDGLAVPDFALGTALELRRSPVWKENIEQVSKAVAEGRTIATTKEQPAVTSRKRGPPPTKRDSEEKRISKRREFGSVEELTSVQRQKVPSKRERDIARTIKFPEREQKPEEVELQVEIENVQRAISELTPKLDEARSRLAVHKTKFNFIRQFLVIVCDKKLYELGVLGSSVTDQVPGSPPTKGDTASETPDVASTATEEATGGPPAMLEVDVSQIGVETTPDFEKLFTLLYDPSEHFTKYANSVENIIDAHLDHLDRTDSWAKAHWSDIRHLMAWLESLEPLDC
ncbi:hypothetical protein SCHPADRAFT_948135 [Schizopora paradoxa]|uniref:Uncharacterized protein n=1 Tax=Schizopora paradoxa TaxID=27342 RepID=A0A0H2RGB8_9AGAM|nr:hypothetical protein SCHPADRAFT_948135 [Schizopora paradoxa]